MNVLRWLGQVARLAILLWSAIESAVYGRLVLRRAQYVVNVAASGWQPAHEVLVAASGLGASAALVLAFLPPDRDRRSVLARSGAPRDILRAGNAAARR